MKKLSIVLIMLTMCVNQCLNAQEKVGVNIAPPYVIQGEDGELSGITIELWERIAKDLNLGFEYEVYHTSSGSLIDSFDIKGLDFMLGSTTINEDRIDKVDLSMPFDVVHLTIAQKNENQIMKGIIAALTSGDFVKSMLWLFLIVYIWGLLIWFVERKPNEDFHESYGWGSFDGFYFAFVVLTTVGLGDKKPITPWGKVLMIFWMIKSYIITAVFIGSISVTILSYVEKASMLEVSDLYKTKLGTVKNTTSADYLDDQNIKYINYDDVEEGLKAINDGMLETFVYDEPTMKYIINNSKLDVIIADEKFDQQYYGIALKKHHKLLDKVNQLILRYKSNGTYDAIVRKYN